LPAAAFDIMLAVDCDDRTSRDAGAGGLVTSSPGRPSSLLVRGGRLRLLALEPLRRGGGGGGIAPETDATEGSRI
jgi:hypothetical protein